MSPLPHLAQQRTFSPRSCQKIVSWVPIWTLLVSGDAVGHSVPDVAILVLGSYCRHTFTNFFLFNSYIET